jgi:rifamycin polyketide synthase module 9/10
VLVTGAGWLGALLPRHLVVRHGVRRLVLASPRGAGADGAAGLAAELGGLGAQVTVTACDVSDRGQVAALLASVPGGHPLTAVVHTAGVPDDREIGSLTPERLAGVFAPKVDAVRHLDELTRGLDLGAFIVYSSAAGVLMGAGTGGYAAANAFLDGLMFSRQAAGLPGLSLAWGPWEHTSGLVANLSTADQAQINRGGWAPLSPAEGLELFDAALGSGQALLVPAKLDVRGMRAGAVAGREVPHLLRGLAGAGRVCERRRAGRAAGGAGDG